MDTVIKKVNDFFEKSKLQTYKKGEILIRADDNPPGIFFLKQGLVKEYAISKKGEEIIINIFKPNSFFPMSWAINETQNSYYYEAIDETEVYRAGKEEVLYFIKDNPDVLFDLLSRVYKGTDGMITRMVYVMSETAYDRLIAELIIDVKRFGNKDANKYICEISERDLAARTGMTRETISREMKKLKDKKIVTFEKNQLTIQNIDLLEKELTLS